MTANPTPAHVVAVIGGATAGSEIARVLADAGAIVIVIDQNPRPYGKIEDGLPRWHVKQRLDEYAEIDRRLDHPNIHFLPLTRLGRDVQFDELRTRWGLSGIVLSHGAWRDRRFPVEGAERFVDRGLIYQNRLVYWFNHYPEAGYAGPRYQIPPGPIVVGGGLASLDVMKILQIEITLRALAARSIVEDMVALERQGIEPVLESHGLKWDDLGVKPCTLYYRRRAEDMPLTDIAADAPPKRAEAMRLARAKILEKAMRKYLFAFAPLRIPAGIVVEGDRMAGVRFSRTEVADGRVRVLAGSEEEVRAGLTVSSIGSIPEPIAGIPQSGEVYSYDDAGRGLLMSGTTAVFAAGNVLTGKGNIKDSLSSGTEIGTIVAERYLGLGDRPLKFGSGPRRAAAAEAEEIARVIRGRPGLSPAEMEAIMDRVRERQRAIGYPGGYRAWIAKVTPPDLR
jgi:hypothetical protein